MIMRFHTLLDQRRCGIAAQSIVCRMIHSKPTNGKFHKHWIPAAYRGAIKKQETRDPARSLQKGVYYKDHEMGTNAKRSAFMNNNLLATIHSLFQRASYYRMPFTANRDHEIIKHKDADLTPSELKDEIVCLFKNIHQAEFLLDKSVLEQTETHFRGICLSLQNTVKLSCWLQKNTSSEAANDYTDLAEAAFFTLAQFVKERKLLVKTSRTWVRNENASSAEEQGRGWRGWVQTIRSFLLGKTEAMNPVDDNELRKKQRMAHEDPALTVNWSLFRLVMNSITHHSPFMLYKKLERTNVDLTKSRSVADTAKRLVRLIEIMPTSSRPESSTLRLFLDMQCRVCTLDSAQVCYDTYQRFPDINCFALVLKAFNRAVHDEKAEEKKLAAAEQCTWILHSHLNSQYPASRIERIFYCSTVLDAIMTANQAVPYPNVFAVSDNLIRQGIGKSVYRRLIQGLTSETFAVHSTFLPILNFMTYFYATSGDNEKIDIAKRMLAYIVENDRGASGRTALRFVDSFNAVANAVLRKYENKSIDEEGQSEANREMALLFSVLEGTLAHRKVGYRLNEDTFILMFRLLVAVKPVDMEKRTFLLLTTMEKSRLLAEKGSFEITVRIYNRALRCLKVAASQGLVKQAPAKALELIEKMDVQSTPFLMSIRELQMDGIPPLYSPLVRPTATTYKILLRLCEQTLNEEEHELAADIALKACRRMKDHNINMTSEMKLLVQRCCERLSGPLKDERMAEVLSLVAVDERSDGDP